MSPQVSIVIPSYNHEPFVRETIQSVLDQSFGDLEIVVTDDASTDRTAEIIREFHDPRIDLVVLDKNLGAVVALNASIRRSRGEFLCYLATDDFFLPGKIEKQVRYLKENPHVGAVFGMPKRIDQRGDRMRSDPLFSIPSWSSNFSRRKWLRQFFFHGNSLCHPTAMVRRSVYDQVGLFDARLWQLPDLDLWVRICAKFEIDILADELTAFRVLDGAQNVSAPRADSVLRTAFEFFQILKHYKYLTPDFAREIFGEDLVYEKIDARGPYLQWLAELALRGDLAAHRLFALDTMYEGFAGTDGSHRLVSLTGDVGAFLHFTSQIAGWLGAPPEPEHQPKRDG